jgi:hypothetical protein
MWASTSIPQHIFMVWPWSTQVATYPLSLYKARVTGENKHLTVASTELASLLACNDQLTGESAAMILHFYIHMTMYFPPNNWYTKTKLHGITSYQTAIFNVHQSKSTLYNSNSPVSGWMSEWTHDCLGDAFVSVNLIAFWLWVTVSCSVSMETTWKSELFTVAPLDSSSHYEAVKMQLCFSQHYWVMLCDNITLSLYWKFQNSCEHSIKLY